MDFRNKKANFYSYVITNKKWSQIKTLQPFLTNIDCSYWWNNTKTEWITQNNKAQEEIIKEYNLSLNYTDTNKTIKPWMNCEIFDWIELIWKFIVKDIWERNFISWSPINNILLKLQLLNEN